MKKYNLSAIMKRAWTLVKKSNMTMSEALKKAWSEAKNVRANIEMCVVGKETFTVNAQTGEVSGKTYHAKEFLKKNFNAKWNGETQQWTVDVQKFNSELDNYSEYYKKYIVAEKAVKTVAESKLVNREDGFYSRITYTDGTCEYSFVG